MGSQNTLVNDAGEETSFSESEADTDANELRITIDAMNMKAVFDEKADCTSSLDP